MSLEKRSSNIALGHDAIRFAPMSGEEELRRYVVEHIDEAIESNWVVPYYQPVVRSLTGKLCGVEALARWEDPTYGLLSPSAFIGALEDAKLIHKLDCEIIRQVCHRLRKSLDLNESVVPVSFNLSRLDFDLCDIFAEVEEAAREYEVPRSMLNIEITETVFGSDPSFMADVVDKFHTVGYQVWMDDFGSGYSTLNVLKDFDFDELKIDMEFLNRFGRKSKTILASVVDMAKKLGIQTLAEGVETEEQRQYLHSIGCEKMQGYLFGKPCPYDHETYASLCDAFKVESATERRYFSEIGAVNTLSLSERDFMSGNTTRDYETSMPLAFVEYEAGLFKIIDSNRVFCEGLENLGVATLSDAERTLNDPSLILARQARRIVEKIEQDKFARIDYVVGNTACVIRVKHITSRNGKIAMLASIDDSIERSERERHGRMSESLPVLYSIYEHIDIIHLDEGFVEPVFGNSGYELQYHASKFNDATAQFAESEIFPGDRKRYLAFMDHDTMVRRIQESGESYIVGFFRVRQRGGDYAWKLFALIRLVDKLDNQVMLCIRGTHWTNDGLFQMAFDVRDEENPISVAGIMSSDMRLTGGSLWRAVSQSDDFSFFWKDRERRFVGANQSFLDYYGFESVDAIIGKTDEDMGWHIDPVPFMEDELRVLNEGVHVKKKMGQCIVRGEVRDIMATKHPVYRNGRIVGLVGFFIDASAMQDDGGGFGDLPLRDPVTDLLNYTGLESATWRFVDSYVKLGIDFSMISVNIENYSHINDEFGPEFGDKVLARVGVELRKAAGSRCAIGHVYAERFVILVQDAADEDLDLMCADIEARLSGITRIDGVQCTVFALASFSRFSEHRDIESMKRTNRDSRLSRRANWGDSSESDVITSTLL